MKYNPDKHNRRSIRLKGYDYSQPGLYFVTVCTQNREMLFGEIVKGQIELNKAGQMIKSIWEEIPIHLKRIKIDYFQIMPNHFHGIIKIVGADHSVCPEYEQPHTGDGIDENTGQSQGIAPTLSLSGVVQRFKSLTTKLYIDGVNQNDWLPFNGKLWQRNYYEHIIRDEPELNRIRQYITENPLKWQDDKYFAGKHKNL